MTSKKADDNMYLKSTVSTGGKFMTNWQSCRCWHDEHNQSKDNSQKNLGEKILHDESSNTTLGGIVKLDEQPKQ